MKRLALIVAVLVSAVACETEPELGAPCDPDEELVAEAFDGPRNQDVVLRGVRFENCSAAICMTTDNSRPYCSHPCESDDDCLVGGERFSCVDFSTPGDPMFLCAAEPGVIEERDATYGR